MQASSGCTLRDRGRAVASGAAVPRASDAGDAADAGSPACLLPDAHHSQKCCMLLWHPFGLSIF